MMVNKPVNFDDYDNGFYDDSSNKNSNFDDIYDYIQNSDDLKKLFDQKNNSVTKKYIKFGIDVKKATSLSFMFTLFVIMHMSNLNNGEDDKKVDFIFK